MLLPVPARMTALRLATVVLASLWLLPDALAQDCSLPVTCSAVAIPKAWFATGVQLDPGFRWQMFSCGVDVASPPSAMSCSAAFINAKGGTVPCANKAGKIFMVCARGRGLQGRVVGELLLVQILWGDLNLRVTALLLLQSNARIAPLFLCAAVVDVV